MNKNHSFLSVVSKYRIGLLNSLITLLYSIGQTSFSKSVRMQSMCSDDNYLQLPLPLLVKISCDVVLITPLSEIGSCVALTRYQKKERDSRGK